eukprot:TRINITY_DN11397_c0_g1_i1.p1 TRINITY_DN11397_c0_g1~~TRINITY_DN11397_c0_g1_i1.p1  ORF type:complete len:540 (-),score=114.57 TRINITY_DN11397_c0_g1_i1:18-1637(-)
MFIYLAFLVVLCLGQRVVFETEPGNNDQDTAATTLRMEGPLRIEGSITSGDVDYYYVEVSPSVSLGWVLRVFDSCSVTENLVNPKVKLTFTGGSSLIVSSDGELEFEVVSDQLIAIKVEAGLTGGQYGLVIAPELSEWDGSCDTSSVVSEVEPNNEIPQRVTAPSRIQASLSVVSDIDLYQVSSLVSGTYHITILPFECNPAIVDTCETLTKQPQISVSVAGGAPVVASKDVNTQCVSLTVNVDTDDVLDIKVTSGVQEFIGSYGLVVKKLDEDFDYSCSYRVVIPTPPPEDPLGRWICSNPGGANLFEKAIGPLSVPFYIPEAELSFDKQQDYYYFGVESGSYTFMVLGKQSRLNSCVEKTCEFDSILSLYDVTGTGIGYNDDMQSSLCSGFNVDLVRGNYYVVVQSFAGGSYGQYSLIAFKENNASVFETPTCPNADQNECPIGSGSGVAFGDLPVMGSYYDEYWWVVLVILAIIFVVPLAILIVYLALTLSKPKSLPEPAAFPMQEVQHPAADNEAIELSANSENVHAATGESKYI